MGTTAVTDIVWREDEISKYYFLEGQDDALELMSQDVPKCNVLYIMSLQ